jgi:hypothetical protein
MKEQIELNIQMPSGDSDAGNEVKVDFNLDGDKEGSSELKLDMGDPDKK